MLCRLINLLIFFPENSADFKAGSYCCYLTEIKNLLVSLEEKVARYLKGKDFLRLNIYHLTQISAFILWVLLGSAPLKAEQSACCVKAIEELMVTSKNKVAECLKDKNFQQFLDSAQQKHPTNLLSKDQGKGEKGDLYIFVSLSLGEKTLLNLAEQAREFGGTLVLRGFKEGSYRKTAQFLQKIIEKTGQGFVVDPELFQLFAIKVVPTIILTRPFRMREDSFTPLHDRMQGNVTIFYALEKFSKEGDLKYVAGMLLRKKRGRE